MQTQIRLLLIGAVWSGPTLFASSSVSFGHIITLHSQSVFAANTKIYGMLYNQSSSIAFDEHLVIGRRQKATYFSAFHGPPHGSLVSIGQHFVTTRVIYTQYFIKKDWKKLNYRIGPKRTKSPNRTRLCRPCIAAIAGCETTLSLFEDNYGHYFRCPNTCI